ncbi:hypothetical protein [Nonomuraea sp. NPDC003754]
MTSTTTLSEPAWLPTIVKDDGSPGSSSPMEWPPRLSPDGRIPPVLPDEFWRARPLFTHVRQAAHSRLIAPDGVLAAVLVRAAVSTDYRVLLPAIVGRYQPPNLYAALVAASGGGKGASLDAAGELLPFVSTPDHRIREASAGSGEGLAKKFFTKVSLTDDRGRITGTEWEQTAHALLVRVDEGSMLGPLMKRQGQTTTETLRQAWSGERLGGSYADVERGQQLAPHTYRLCIAMGVQPETAAFLFEDTHGGLPQRFLWLAVQSPDMPSLDAIPDHPGRLRWTAPVINGRHLQANVMGLQRCLIDIAPEIAHEIRVAHLAQVEGRAEIDSLDGHANLSRLKVASILGVLDGRLEVTPEDWALAGTLMRTSSAVRTWIRERVSASEKETRRARNKAHAEREVMADVAKERARVLRMAVRVRRCVVRDAGEGVRTTKRRVNQAFKGPEKEFLDAAIDHALAMDWVRYDGAVYTLGGSAPTGEAMPS